MSELVKEVLEEVIRRWRETATELRDGSDIARAEAVCITELLNDIEASEQDE